MVVGGGMPADLAGLPAVDVDWRALGASITESLR
jgi:hypothetical protein